ncbi:hypothetical protein ACVW0P_000659 [Mucilaginibacter sp. UYNi724]
MASIKVWLRERESANGEYAIIIQILKDRKKSVITLGHSIKESDWDVKNAKVKKSHPNSAWLNNLIAKRVSEANDKLIQLLK